MHINEALLLAYQDAGATSSNLTEAEYQALVANGAADGKWHTFLRADGWTGCLDEMMYTYLGNKGYAGTLSERLHQAAAALDLFRAAYSPIDEFTGGLNGWLYDGSAGASAFLQSAGGAVAGDGDPLGSVQDLSGNGNDILQATGGAKPVCKVNGGVRSIYVTSSKLMACTFASAIPAVRTEVWVVKVMSNLPNPSEAYPHILTGTGGLDFQMIRNSATDVVEVWDGTSFDGSATARAYGTPYIFVLKRVTGLGPDVSVYTYDTNGSVIDIDAGMAYHNPNAAASLSIGLAAPQLPHHVCFSMGIEGHPDVTNLLTYLNTQFSTWSPT